MIIEKTYTRKVWAEARTGKEHDRRIKLSDDDREEIRGLHKQGTPTREIARRFITKCSRRLIQFVIFPERDIALKATVKAEKRWLKYYTTESRRKYMQNHRAHIRKLLDNKIKYEM